MKDSIEDSHAININNDNDDCNKKYEDIFFLESNLASDFNISINEESFMPFQRTDSLAQTKPTTIVTVESNLDCLSRSNSNSNYSSIELKRKKNREASKASRKKKKEDIICLVKTNELLKEKINKLKSQLDNNICSQCLKRISDQSINKLVSNDNLIEKSSKPGNLSSFILSTTSSSSLNPSPNRAKTAMFISMVVLFCVIVNSYSDKSRSYLRQVTINNYFNDHISINEDNNLKELNNASQCFELLKYYYSITKPPFNANQKLSFEQIINEPTKDNHCQEITIGQEIDYNTHIGKPDINKLNASYSFKVQADKKYLLWKIFNDFNNYNEDPNKPFNLECVHFRFDINLKHTSIIT